MKKILLTCTSILFAIFYMNGADETFDYLRIRQSDGAETVVPSENLSITFSDGKMNVESKEGLLSFELNNLTSLNFSDSTTSYPLLETAGKCTVWNLKGISMGRYESLEAARAALSSDVYIVGLSNGEIVRIIF